MKESDPVKMSGAPEGNVTRSEASESHPERSAVGAQSKGEGRPRWLTILLDALGPTLVIAAIVAVQVLLLRRTPPIVASLATIVAVLAVYALHARYLVRRRPVEIAPRALPSFIWGVLLGTALFCAVMLCLGLLGAYRVTGSTFLTVDLPAAAAASLMQGVIEETIVRGYLFRWIAMRNVLVGVIVSALVFGGLHFLNPGATVFSSLAIAIEAGILLSAAYVVSGNLWLPIGIHAAWNFTEGTIFNIPVSGMPSSGIILGRLAGPDWLTGGKFGVEASLVAVIVCLIAGLALLWLGRARLDPKFFRAVPA